MKIATARWLRALSAIAASMVALQGNAEPPAGAAPVPNATVEQPRPFGYVIGDLATQRILLQIDGRPFEPDVLPPAARLGVWLERRAPHIESADDRRRWLVVEYQIINAPRALTTISLPAWELKAKSGTTTLRIGSWPISVSPLTPQAVFAKGGLAELRPDRPAQSIATTPIREQIAVWSIACGVTLAAWLGWVVWRNWREASTRPFARALREIRRLEDTAPEAWYALHRAFDRTAGRVMQTATLATLFQRAPQLAPMRAKIELFFSQSAERFFGAGLTAEPLSVRRLCVELRRIEKRHER
ncbi:MAG TPA: calcium incorporation protein MxaA [Burkholderiales bacterium]|nr:calcium incorporation protein MxaA [Burkholderiales bacterium]